MRKLLGLVMVFFVTLPTEALAEEFEFFEIQAAISEQTFAGGGPSNQFPRVRGLYNGLLMPTNSFVSEHSGFFRIWVNSDRDFTGRFDVGDTTIWLRGHFDRHGKAGVLVYRRDWDDCFCFHARQLFWIVRLELVPGTDTIKGTIENARRGWITSLSGYRSFGEVDGPAPQAGRYTLRLPSNAEPTVAPPGEGYGSVKVTSGGRVQVIGALADSTPFSRSANLSTNGWWPFFLPLDDGRGALIGWINFSTSSSSNISGELLWVKPRRVARRFYPEGYVGTVTARGSRYIPPAADASGLSWESGVLGFSAGNLATPLANMVTLLRGGLIDNGGDIPELSVRLSRSTGVFRGKFLNPETGRRTPFSGILDQQVDIGAGFFLGSNQGGLVRMEPAP